MKLFAQFYWSLCHNLQCTILLAELSFKKLFVVYCVLWPNCQFNLPSRSKFSKMITHFEEYKINGDSIYFNKLTNYASATNNIKICSQKCENCKWFVPWSEINVVNTSTDCTYNGCGRARCWCNHIMIWLKSSLYICGSCHAGCNTDFICALLSFILYMIWLSFRLIFQWMYITGNAFSGFVV